MKKLFTEDAVGETMVFIYDTESKKAIPIHRDDDGNTWTLESARSFDWDNSNFGGCEDESGLDDLIGEAVNYGDVEAIVDFDPDEWAKIVEI